MSEQVLAALEPAALELSLAAAEQVEQERAALVQLWQQRRERAAYEAERAARQYQAVEPENRLVARTLERAWEEKLAAQQQLEEDYHRFVREQPRVLTEPEREAIRQLAADIPALWAAPTTTPADRKEIVRQVVERVEVDAQGKSEQVRVRIIWVGGGQTEGSWCGPSRGMLTEVTMPAVRAGAGAHSGGLGAAVIARQLEADGYPPLRGGPAGASTASWRSGGSGSGRAAPPRPVAGSARPRRMVGARARARLGVAPLLSVRLDPARPGARPPGRAGAPSLDRLGRHSGNGTTAAVSSARPRRGTRRRWTAAYPGNDHQKGPTA